MKMDIFPSCGSIEKYQSKRGYQRLKSSHEVITNEEHMKIAASEIISLPTNITFSIKFTKRVRDSYVEMMLCFAGHIAQLNNGNVFLSKRIPSGKSPSSSVA
ncbi:hypothetical protein I3842_15G121900 [Carya illinoinensis]|uniref:Uncharacterized protein n=1 Tax=Carya illinoinensis TaxID=32201 RepID=A0A922A6P4_CARIL|nr:hypothetical protein I3842_15G121900 [Carya illinoinensis]